MSSVIKKTYEMVRKLEAQGKPWLEIQHEVESANIREGDYRPLCVSSENAPYCLRFVPQRQPQILSRGFDEELNRIGRERSLVVQMRCTGYNLFMDTKQPDGLGQRIRKSFGKNYRSRLLRVLYLDKYVIELERPDLQGMPEALEEIGRQLYGMAA